MHSNTRQAVRVDAFGVREMVLGKSRHAQAHQQTIMHSNTRQALNASTRSVNAKWYWVNHGRLTSEQSCTRTLDRQRTIMHSNTRQALNASTRSVYAKWYWVNHGRLTSERQAHQRTQSLPSATHRHSSITRPCQARSQGGFGGCGRTPLFLGPKKKSRWCPRLAAACSGWDRACMHRRRPAYTRPRTESSKCCSVDQRPRNDRHSFECPLSTSHLVFLIGKA